MNTVKRILAAGSTPAALATGSAAGWTPDNKSVPASIHRFLQVGRTLSDQAGRTEPVRWAFGTRPGGPLSRLFS